MFKAIVRFSIRKKLFVGLTTLFLFIGGIYAMLTLPIDAVPDITNNQVQIVTVSSYACAAGSGAAHHHAHRNSDEQHHECRRYPFRQSLRAISGNGRLQGRRAHTRCPPADQRADTNRIQAKSPPNWEHRK